ncbi:MAG: MFS transporter [Acidimicrobiia bacterium]
MRSARHVYLFMEAVSAFAATAVFSIVALYRIRVAGLDDLQLVLAGTVMEGAILLCEIPTGVIADVVSRRASVIIGTAGMGLGFLLEASWPSATGVLLGQAVWGIAYTCTSGATVAWIAGELGEPDEEELTGLFLRSATWSSFAAMLGLITAFAIGVHSLRTPLIIGGAVQLGLAVFLVARMPEQAFSRVEQRDRSTFQQLRATTSRGMRALRSSRVLLLLALAIFVAGGASEAFDRYDQRHLLTLLGDRGDVGWRELRVLGGIAFVSTLLGLVIPRWVRRRRPSANRRRLTRWLVGLTLIQVVGLVAFGLAGSAVVGAISVIVVGRVRSVREKLLGAWIVPLTPPGERATVLSTLSQADAVSQVLIGPVFGGIGRGAGVPVALVVSAGALAPTIPILVAAAGQPTASRVARVAEQSVAEPISP